MSSKLLETHIKEMRALSWHLKDYNYPTSNYISQGLVDPLKFREVVVDGYELVMHYSLSEYLDSYLETLNIHSKYCPFLPFYIVAKIAKKFLGNQNLSLIEAFKDEKKIYCWTCTLDKFEKKSVLNDLADVGEKQYFEDLEYYKVNPDAVKLY